MILRRALAAAIVLSLASPAKAELTAVGYDVTNYTSDFLMGHVVVSVIFPESNGGADLNVETWSESRQANALSEIMAGLDWWTRQNPKSPLSFTVVSQTVPTKYEPVTRPYYDEAQWIPDVMSRIGYTGSRFGAARAHINDLRQQYNADWGFVVYVVDSLYDANGKFADGYFAYAYLGGPYLVMTYDNNGYGIGNMDVVFAHEMGHVFHALDEYAGASSPNDVSNGYFPTVNGNHQYATTANSPESIMRGGIRWGLDDWARQMLGWKDSNKNGRDDIADQPPTVTYASQPSSLSGPPAFTGNAKVSVLPRQSNPQGYGFTVDTIAKVEYKHGGDGWTLAAPVDGNFNSGSESFNFALLGSAPGLQSVSAQDVDVRVTTNFSLNSSDAGGGVAAGSGALANTHPFPNPYKPNSNLGHPNFITFKDLTPGSRIQIFTPNGDAVYDVTVDPATSAFQWDVVNDDGDDLASGVYLYLITDEAGNKKDGKLAVVR